MQSIYLRVGRPSRVNVNFILLTLTGTVPGKGNGSLLCFARFMEREIARKTKTNVGGKWQCPLITQVKRIHIVYKSMSIAAGLDK